MTSAGDGVEDPDEGMEENPKTWDPFDRFVAVTDAWNDVLPEERASAGAYRAPNAPGLFARADAPTIFISLSLIIGPF